MDMYKYTQPCTFENGIYTYKDRATTLQQKSFYPPSFVYVLSFNDICNILHHKQEGNNAIGRSGLLSWNVRSTETKDWVAATREIDWKLFLSNKLVVIDEVHRLYKESDTDEVTIKWKDIHSNKHEMKKPLKQVLHNIHTMITYAHASRIVAASATLSTNPNVINKFTRNLFGMRLPEQQVTGFVHCKFDLDRLYLVVEPSVKIVENTSDIYTTKQYCQNEFYGGDGVPEDAKNKWDAHMTDDQVSYVGCRHPSRFRVNMSNNISNYITRDLEEHAPMLHHIKTFIETWYVDTKRTGGLLILSSSKVMTYLWSMEILRYLKYPHFWIMGKDKTIQWYPPNKKSRVSSISKTWIEHREMRPTDTRRIRIVLMRTDDAPEGIDLPGIDTVINTSLLDKDRESGGTFTEAIQAFGRAERLCNVSKLDRVDSSLKLRQIWYVNQKNHKLAMDWQDSVTNRNKRNQQQRDIWKNSVLYDNIVPETVISNKVPNTINHEERSSMFTNMYNQIRRNFW